MGIEAGDLGPLWEGEPKTSGFRLRIPDPEDLINWVNSTAAACGDMTAEQFMQLNLRQSRRFFAGQSSKLIAPEKHWLIDLPRGCFRELSVELTAGYSPQSGEWGDIIFYLEFSHIAEMLGQQWQFPAQAESVAEYLRKYGLAAVDQPESDQCQRVLVFGSNNTFVEVSLGYTTPELRQAAALGPTTDPSDPIIIRLEPWSLKPSEAKANLQLLQQTLSYLIDGLCGLAGESPPDIVFELSSATELS